jgi:hypothetical protein
MPRRRATLAGMSLAHLDRILAFVCDVIDAQGGDWDATEALLRRTYDGEDLDHALTYATGYLIAYAEPGGPEFIRGMRDCRRRLVPAEPGRRGWARGRATG